MFIVLNSSANSSTFRPLRKILASKRQAYLNKSVHLQIWMCRRSLSDQKPVWLQVHEWCLTRWLSVLKFLTLLRTRNYERLRAWEDMILWLGGELQAHCSSPSSSFLWSSWKFSSCSRNRWWRSSIKFQRGCKTSLFMSSTIARLNHIPITASYAGQNGCYYSSIFSTV